MATYKKKKKIVKKKTITKKTTAKRKGKVYEGGTLPPVVIPLPRKAKRKIPKAITKRTPTPVPKRKSAVERERRVQFAKDNPLMQRNRQTPPPIPSRLRGRPALDTSMLLAPMGAGAAIKAAASLRPSLSRTKRAAAALGKRAATGLRGRSAARKPKKARKRTY